MPAEVAGEPLDFLAAGHELSRREPRPYYP